MKPVRSNVRLPRALLLWWSGWLLCSWALCFGVHGWIMPSSVTFSTASQRLLFSIMLGITLVWPVYRFVGRPARTPRLLALVDWATIFVTTQVALWPLRVPAQWSLERVGLIDASIWSWGLVISAIVALGTSASRHIWRVAAMSACLALCVAAPLLALFNGASSPAVGADSLLEWSPLTAVWRYSGIGQLHTLGDEWTRIAIVATVGIIAWIGVMLLPRTGSSGSRASASRLIPG